jgi:alpha-methylacyl-CoA racemase
MQRLGLAGEGLPPQEDRGGWDRIRVRLRDLFRTRTRDEWSAILEGTDACYAPVLDMDECVRHPHNVARRTHVDLDGVLHPAPAPRFSATPSTIRKAPPAAGEDTDSALLDWGFSRDDISSLKAGDAIR